MWFGLGVLCGLVLFIAFEILMFHIYNKRQMKQNNKKLPYSEYLKGVYGKNKK